MKRTLLLTICCLATSLGCRTERSKDWREGMTCIAMVPVIPGEADVVVEDIFKRHNIYALGDGGSIAYPIYVKSKEAERARELLRRDSRLEVLSENNGILQLRLPRKPKPTAE